MANRQEPNGRTARDVALPDENRQSWRPQDEAYQGRGRRPASEEDDRFEDERFLHFDRDRYDRDHVDRDRDRFAHWEDRRDRGYPGSFEDRYARERAVMNDDRLAPYRATYDERGFSERERLARGPRGYDFDDGAPDFGTGGGFRTQPWERHGARAVEHDEGWSPGAYHGNHRGKGPATFTRSDERIRDLVCEALTDDDRVDATHVEVHVKGGDVTLTGTVEDRPQKRAAEDCAESVSGVKDVQNQLRVIGKREGEDKGRVMH